MKYSYSLTTDFTNLPANTPIDIQGVSQQMEAASLQLPLLQILETGDPDVVDAEFSRALTAQEKTDFDAIVATHDGSVKPSSEPALNSKGQAVVSIDKFTGHEGTSKTVTSPNWCDPCSWYPTSVEHKSVVMQSSDNKEYSPVESAHQKPWIDNKHGRYANEDYLANDAGQVPYFKVYVNDALKVEADPDDLTTNDFVVDYENHKVVFHAPLPAGSVVKCDLFTSENSIFSFRGDPSRVTLLRRVEGQFTHDCLITNSVFFQPWMIHPDHGHMPVPGQNPKVYKTMYDFIDEANGNYPEIPTPTSSQSQYMWRNIRSGITTFPWNYESPTELNASVIPGLYMRVWLEKHKPFIGTKATATFYSVKE